MGTRFYAITLAALVFGLAPSAQAGYLETPDYPLNANEQLYANLAKLPVKERHDRLVEGAKKEGSVAFIQTLPGTLGRGVTKFFRDQYAFIKVEETNLGTNYAMERLVVEERANKHITDVTGGDITEASYPLDLGFLARFPTPATDAILPQYRGSLDKHNRWIVYAWLEKGVSYNAALIKEEDAPKGWMDLCNPRFKGQFSIEPARTRFVSFLHKMLGEEKFKEWLKCIAANEPIVMRGATVRMELMLAGDHAIQGENAFYTGVQFMEKRGPERVKFRMVLSDPLMVQPSSCVINRMAPNPNAAALFCDKLLDKDVQQFMWDNYRNPMTMPSRFMPRDVTLIPVGPIPAEEANRLMAMWAATIGTNKGN